MHLTVEQDHTDIPDMGACKRAFLHFVHDAFQYGGQEALVDDSTHNTIQEDEFTTPVQLEFFATTHGETLRIGHTLKPRLHLHIYLGKLSGSPRLLLMAITGLNRFAYGLPVRDTRPAEACAQVLRKVLQLPFDHGQVQLSLAMDDRLLELLRHFQEHRRVFLADLVDGAGQFFLFSFLRGFYGDAHERGWE